MNAAVPHPVRPVSELELLARVHRHRDPQARAAVIESGMRLVHHVARRFDQRGIPYEELVQVGSIGLINSVDRFDPGRGVRFSTFAVPHIAGEIRRYFRDHGWGLRVTRSVQENAALADRHTARLIVELQRMPTIKEVAAACELPVDALLAALEGARNYTLPSLDAPLSDDAVGGSRHDVVGVEERGYDRVDARLTVAEGLRCLESRERRILHLRFVRGMNQTEIAAEVGISQMHVSRLLRQALDDMRRHLEREPEPAPADRARVS